MSKPAIIVISSHVARGSVGNRSIVFALETMGFPVWVVPTVLLPWHPGHGPSTRITPNPIEFEKFLNELRDSRWTTEVGGLLTGYMASAAQVEAVSNFTQALKQKNPDMVHLCDPVLGDHGQLYIEEDVASNIRDLLIPVCDVATPNLFEASWIAGIDTPQTPAECVDILDVLPSKRWLITSCPTDIKNEIGALYLDGTVKIHASHKKLEHSPNGSGDLTAALFLGHLLSGATAFDALKMTTSSTLEILINSLKKQSDELILSENSECILKPKLKINIRDL